MKEKSCQLCPRKCRVDREKGEKGFCGMSSELTVARASLHMWEEPCISGQKGSGTVFFSGCNLHCVFCQNDPIANGSVGEKISQEELAQVFLELQNQGANNINLVTGSHYIPQIAHALRMAKEQGLQIPVVYNTSSYESVEALQLLDGLVDIYLPDLKYMDENRSSRYSHAKDYFEVARKAIAEMYRQVGTPLFYRTAKKDHFLDAKAYNNLCDNLTDGEELLMKKGVIVRHLLMPDGLEDSKRVISYLYNTYGDYIFLSIMNQFTPLDNVKNIPELNRKVTDAEYEELLDFAIDLGVENAFLQEGDVAEESFIPDFQEDSILDLVRKKKP